MNSSSKTQGHNTFIRHQGLAIYHTFSTVFKSMAQIMVRTFTNVKREVDYIIVNVIVD